VEERPNTTFEEDFISVGPKNHILKLNANRSVKSVQGYVNTDNGAVSTTALLDEALDYNLISLSDVHRFGLDMEPPDDEEPVCFQTEQGEKKSCGQVVLVWDEGVPSRKPFRVRCLVYGHDIRPLLFGKPFLDRRTHYWSVTGGVKSGIEERVIFDGRGRDKDEMRNI
jgi:hypothetical protein